MIAIEPWDIFTGGLLIIMAFLVRKYPGLIAGYNDLPDEKKTPDKTEKGTRMMRNTLLVLGFMLILVPPSLRPTNPMNGVMFMIVAIVLGVTFMIIRLHQIFK